MIIRRRPVSAPAPHASLSLTIATALFTFFSTSATGHAQASRPCDPADQALPGIAASAGDYAAVARLISGDPRRSLFLRPSSRAAGVHSAAECGGPWTTPAADTIDADAGVHLWPASVDVVFNSAYPRGGRYGLLWAGGGVSTLLSAGASARVGPVTAGVVPAAAFQQNRSFDYPRIENEGFSEYVYPWSTSIDWPIRHGPDAFWSTSAGQSHLRLDFSPVSAGISTENLWWGPGRRNALLLGNDAPGFPHVFLGSGEGWRTPIGTVELELVWGRLTESLWFDDDPSNDHRFLALMGLGYAPSFAPGLSLGFARLYAQRYDSGALGIRDFLPFFETPLKSGLVSPDRPSGDDEADQLAAFMIRYSPPRSGFEVYAEWGRGDHAWDMADFLAEPEHNHAWTVGFQQAFQRGERVLRVAGELTNLNPPTSGDRPPGPWYQHSELRQGHTHRGQLLGASIGTASDGQFLGVDMFTTRGRFGLYVERIRFDEYTHAQLVAPIHSFTGHDVEITLGTDNYLRLGDFDVRAGLAVSSRRNRHFGPCGLEPSAPRNCQQPAYRELNLHIPLGVVWRPGALLRRSGPM
jgi:hypothetical protein